MIPRFLVRMGVLALVLLVPGAALAQGVTIEHEEIGCIVAGKYPKINACITPASMVKKARVYFRPETLTAWYYVDLNLDTPCYWAALAKPGKALIDKKIFYYVDVQGEGSGRTPEYAPVVVASAEQCKKKLPVAPLSATGPAAVFPAFPAGFVGAAGVPAAVVAGGVAAAAVVTSGAVLLANDDKPAPPPPPPVPPTPPPATTPPVTPPPPTAPPPPSSGLVVACQAAPRSGEVPLRVSFATFPSGGTGTYEFEWTFGDGAGATNPNPSHTFLSPGVFNSTVLVRSGAQTASCSRAITVTTPPTPPPPPTTAPPPASFKLDASLTGSGTGVVTGPGINCLGDCTETYPAGTVVTLNASPTGGSTFIGWSGACNGTGPCTVTMTADKAVTAKFEAFPKLTVTKTGGTGTGDVAGSGINCGATCTASYTPGTVVTLNASPTGGSTFAGWSGGGCSGTGTCTVTMDVSKTANAQFDKFFTLTFTSRDDAMDCIGAPSVTIDPPKTVCTATPSPGTTCSQTYPAGTPVQITSSTNCGSVVCWSGACASTPSTLGSTCTLTMDTDKSAVASFRFGSCVAAIGPPVRLSWSIELDAPGAVGEVAVDGQVVVATSGRRVQAMATKRAGEATVSATIVKSEGKPGTWRFEFNGQSALKPGSLRVVAGTVALVTGDTVVFRLQGKPGERIVFTFEVED